MADNEELKESLVDFDERLREIEISHSSLSTTIVSMNTNITEMKQMFQKFLIDSERISEMAGKLESINRLEKEVQVVTSKYDEMYQKLIIVDHTCRNCSINKVNDYIKDVSDKVNRIEVSISEMKETKGKMSGFWGNIAQSIVTIIILYILYIVAVNIQVHGNIVANPPDVKKGEITMTTEANAAPFTSYTAKFKSKEGK